MRRRPFSRAIARAIHVAGVALGLAASAQGRWPREIQLEQATLVVYQPQIENIEGVTLSGRMAVSWEPKGGSAVFGVVWFDARFLADKDSRDVQIDQYTVRKVRFPESTPEQEKKLAAYLEQEVPKWDLKPSLDDLENAVAVSKKEAQSEKRLKSDPPKLIFANDPAVLLLYDGKPLLRPLEKASLQRAVNTPLFVVCEPEPKQCFLNGARFWYQAPDPAGPWTSVEGPSPAVKAFFDANPPPAPGSEATTEEQREAAKAA